jgi:hypothetical protein
VPVGALDALVDGDLEMLGRASAGLAGREMGADSLLIARVEEARQMGREVLDAPSVRIIDRQRSPFPLSSPHLIPAPS